VGHVAATGQPRIALDVGADAVHFKNPHLPETRSEMALPLKVGKQVIGVLDVQSAEREAFDEDDIAVLQTMADQLAVALQNARAYERLRDTADKLREVDELKMQFIANMSHELRTPLNSIIGFSRVILKGIDGPITELQKKDLTTIYNSGQHLLDLINDVLDISKIEAGKMELDLAEVELPPLIESALNTTTGLLRDKPILLRRELTPLPRIRADGQRVRQILLNLLSNAAKFTQEGEIAVRAGLENGSVFVHISDTGPGIPADKLEHLFDAFYQVDGSATRRAGGTGLGLAITKSFVEMHGGTIGVQSTVGAGTTFSVHLPILGPGLHASPTLPGEKHPTAVN
jgi:signal transduction histidine kinase